LRRVPAVQDVQPQQGDTGKRTGKFIGGMMSFYGNVMKGAVGKLKGKSAGPKEEQAPPYG